MKKVIKYIRIIMLHIATITTGVLIADNVTLHNDLVRLHVVANSDSDDDQRIKIAVKNAVVSFLQDNTTSICDVKQAKDYVKNNLAEFENLANNTLSQLGSKDKATVRFLEEKFDIRQYDTFSLPSGVYNSLRIEIGDGKGRNWWCVVFPALCMPTTVNEFEDVAVSAGLNQNLVKTLSSEHYAIRFFFLDCIGRLENFFSFL